MLAKAQPDKESPAPPPGIPTTNPRSSLPLSPIHTPPPYIPPPELAATQKYPPYSQRPSYSYLYLNVADQPRRRSGIVVPTRVQEVRGYVSRHRYWLALIAVLAVAVMVVGIVLVAHTFYVGFGGQGFLKRETDWVDGNAGGGGGEGGEWWVGGDLSTEPKGGEGGRTHKLRIRLGAAAR